MGFRLPFVATGRTVRYALVATLAFTLGSVTVVAAGPTISGFVGITDGTNTAKVTANSELSVSDASLARFSFDSSGNLRTAQQGTQNVAGTVNVGNLPTTQNVAGTISVGNFPATQTIAGNVNVGNFPATQAVSGSVAVSNLPLDASGNVRTSGTQTLSGSIEVSNFPSTQNVTVVNSASSPVLTRDSDSPGRNAVKIESVRSGIAGEIFATYTVPAGQRLIIDSFSGEFITTEGIKPTLIRIVAGATGLIFGGGTSQYATPIFVATQTSGDIYTFALESHLFAEGGQLVLVVANTTIGSAGIVFVDVTITGHLISMP